jgi:hypothetical protein
VAAIAELMNDDGTMARMAECGAFAANHRLKMITVEALAAWQRQQRTDVGVDMLAECTLPVHEFGEWTLRCYRSRFDGLDRHIALVKGAAIDPLSDRIHLPPFFFFFLVSPSTPTRSHTPPLSVQVTSKTCRRETRPSRFASTPNASQATCWEASAATAASSCAHPFASYPSAGVG